MNIIPDSLERKLKELKPEETIEVMVVAKVRKKTFLNMPPEVQKLMQSFGIEKLVYDDPEGKDPYEYVEKYVDNLDIEHKDFPKKGLVTAKLTEKQIRDLAEQPYVSVILENKILFHGYNKMG